MSDLPQDGQRARGVELAVIANRLDGIVGKMINTLVRTGRSGVLNTARDFSCCIVTRDDELLVAGESLPIHVMSGPDLISRAIRSVHGHFAAGDAFLHNSPYEGNSHAADHCAFVPVVDAAGRHRFSLLVKAHQADCGNSLPTTYMGAARDVYEEGALIFPAVRIQQNYTDCADILRMCRARIRVPEQWWGDYLALLGSARVGERELLAVGEELGWDRLQAFTQEWFSYSEERMKSAIRRMPSGTRTAHRMHDPFPGVPDGIPLNVTVRVDAEDALVEVDLRDNGDCQPCGLNLTQSTATTAALVGVFNSLGEAVPPNAGSFRRIRVHLRENCVVGIPRHPASCSVATTNVADRVANAVQSAIAELGDGWGMAETGLVIPPSVAVISGLDPRHGNRRFVNQLFLGFTGGAGGPYEDAWLTILHVGNAGLVYKDSVEIDELHHPIRVEEVRLLPDSEGAGRFRGAPGIRVEYGPVGTTLEVMYTSDGSVHPAKGVRGGLDGTVARQFKRGAGGELTPVEACGDVILAPGETVVSISCGGAGYGDPTERDPDRVAHDVREGLISRERTRRVYRVAIDDAGEPNWDQTRALRRSPSAER